MNSSGGRPPEMTGAWAELVEVMGSVEALATAFKTTTRTVKRWSNGDATPGRLTQEAINEFARLHKCSEPYKLAR